MPQPRVPEWGVVMKQLLLAVGLFAGVPMVVTSASPAHAKKCSADSVQAGPVCMDKYEASVWEIPATNGSGKSNAGLIKKVQDGAVTLAQLTAGNAMQISPASTGTPAFPATFPPNGQWTQPLYAVSIAGVSPTVGATWFQAQQACFNSRKRLPTNAEWQGAVAGTPDPGPDNGTTDCNTTGGSVITGSRSSCVSNWGAFDMVGNVEEWVADWVPLSTTPCPNWGALSDDLQCFAGANTSAGNGPGALVRGGSVGMNTAAGPLAVRGDSRVSDFFNFLGLEWGFRCAR